jgi:hypothetical protein
MGLLLNLFIIFVSLLVMFREKEKPKNTETSKYLVSLITLKNEANKPFYYHNSLKISGPCTTDNSLSLHCKRSYGLYPNHSELLKNSSEWVLLRMIQNTAKFFRPLFPMHGSVRSPDPLLDGSKSIKPGNIVYQEDYPVDYQTYLSILARMDNLTKGNDNISYSYLFDNCASWVSKVLNEHLDLGVSCSKIRFEVFGIKFGVPVLLFAFPGLCSSLAH